MRKEMQGMSTGAVAALIAVVGFALVMVGVIVRGDRPPSPPSKYELIDLAKDEIRHRARDPESVQFGDVWVGTLVTSSTPSGTPVVCGYFNAKNGFGGYVGQQRFFGGPGMLMIDQEQRALIDQAWSDSCILRRR